jgi:hypothetical protein
MQAPRLPLVLSTLLAISLPFIACGRQVGENQGGGGGGGGGDDGGGDDGSGDGSTFTSQLEVGGVTKVDLLFDIDNSPSMGDMQFYVAQAVPDLIHRLVTPNCVDATTGAIAGTSSGGSCASYPGTAIEFPPVHDMHVGIVSSSLGTRGVTGPGAVCDPTSTAWNNTGPFLDGQPALNTHVDDRGELLSRAAGAPNPAEDEMTLADVGAQHFLDWFPDVPANDGHTPNAAGFVPALAPPATILTATGGLGMEGTLEGDFGLMVQGVHAYGCGIGSPVETWYRFLVQPDPYDSIAKSSSDQAEWEGVDATILQQRHDFLRPDSLVAIIDVSDKDDQEIDVRSIGASGYLFMDTTFHPPRATSACATDPNSSECMSCAAAGTSGDPSCKVNGGLYSAENDWGYYIDVRAIHMQQKYGFSAQFPLQRYVLGLTSANVPDRDHEYPAGASSYQGGTQGDPDDLNCANPLFAATLPDGSDLSAATLCNAGAAPAPRSPNLVFYAHIGGVPHQLLQARVGVDKDANGNVICPTGTNQADCPQKATLTIADWTSILGNGPATGGDPYDSTGIDPHMIEYYEIGRTGSDYATGSPETIPACNATSYPTGGGPDPIGGCDWATNVDTPNPQELPVSLEYACIFPLATPRDCSKANDPVDQYPCSCSAVGLTGTQVSPLCGLQNAGAPYAACSAIGSCAKSNDYLKQYFAKAFPTIRELTLAEMLGSQGIVSSLCPIHIEDNAASDDPVYGYRPAVTSIINRLKNALTTQCLPQALPSHETPTGLEVPCTVFATLLNTSSADEETACANPNLGLSVPTASVLAALRAQQHAEWMTSMSGTDPSTLATCEINQISVPQGGSCVGPGSSGQQGWCYVTGAAAGACDTQAILFTAGTPSNGAIVSLQCTVMEH